MANYSTSNFIRNYALTDRAIQLQNKYDQKMFSLNICNYQKSYVQGNNLCIVGEDGEREYVLDFDTYADAINAQNQFKGVADVLKGNCETTTTQVITNLTATPITYLQYKAMQQAGTLSELTWYDVTDTTNLLLIGPGFRVFAKSFNDYQPMGMVLHSHALVTLNTLEDKIQRYELSSQKILAENNSKVLSDSLSTQLFADNDSVITSFNSNNIKASNSSVLNVTNCNAITVENDSNVVLENANTVTINSITQSLSFSTLGFNLSHVSIDRNTTFGKAGRNSMDISASGVINLLSYRDLIDQELTFTTSDLVLNVVLDNKIFQSCGRFRIKIIIGTGVEHTQVNIRDKNNTPIYTATDFHSDSWLVFEYNKTKQLFEFIRIDGDTSLHKVHRTIANTNQNVFVIPYEPNDASKLQMQINGQDVDFGIDFTFTSPNIISWVSPEYVLDFGDKITFIIY